MQLFCVCICTIKFLEELKENVEFLPKGLVLPQAREDHLGVVMHQVQDAITLDWKMPRLSSRVASLARTFGNLYMPFCSGSELWKDLGVNHRLY